MKNLDYSNKLLKPRLHAAINSSDITLLFIAVYWKCLHVTIYCSYISLRYHYRLYYHRIVKFKRSKIATIYCNTVHTHQFIATIYEIGEFLHQPCNRDIPLQYPVHGCRTFRPQTIRTRTFRPTTFRPRTFRSQSALFCISRYTCYRLGINLIYFDVLT